MTWFKVDDQLSIHPKALAAGNAALGLWVRAGSWSAAHLTEGHVPASLLPMLNASRKDASKLVDAGLWERSGSDYVFHDWEQYQPSKAEVEKERASNRDRQRRFRQSRQSNGTVTALRPGVT